jgi:ATP-dependent Lon protease
MVAQPEAPPSPTPAIPELLPILPLRDGTVLFPFTAIPLSVAQERSVRLVDEVMRGDRLVAFVAQRPKAADPPGPEDLYSVGTAATIHQLSRAGDGTLRLIVQGIERVRLLDFVTTAPYLVARVQTAPDANPRTVEVEGLRRAVVDLFRRLAALAPDLPAELAAAAETLDDPRHVAYLVASTVPLSGEIRQELLELNGVDSKLRRLVELLQHEVSVRELGQRITTEAQERMGKAQREFMLREQLRGIQQELGDGEDPELADLRRRIAEAGMPEEARREAEREIERLATIPTASPEHGIVRTFLDTLASLPWNVESGGQIDVPLARSVLDEDHYDLDKIKDRILEYLAVRKLRAERLGSVSDPDVEPLGGVGEVESSPEPNAVRETEVDRTARDPILCFVGPPGVGKTSLGQSIARALGRKFVRISLGGVHDEAEVRGHRRTYIGALPGRIIQGIRRAGANDPVFMLDEIDKVGSDWRGDPTSALLEVLDPAQNHAFIDNYLGVPFDLSHVLFITTANALDPIPDPLRDRLEILPLSGYTDEEKLGIAERYLVPKQLRAHSLTPEELSFEPDAILEIVRGYTREAGVRNLDREIATVCRKVVRAIAEGRSEPVRVGVGSITTYLGRRRFHPEVAERTDRPGVATGLAWTPAGGDILFVEATMMPSADERLILTGMLGDVMRESAQAALSYLRSNAESFGIEPNVFAAKTVHVHVPAGAIPKDGPSAGVTILTALASLAIGKPVRPDTAMTGEITLRGAVLPVGGIREKVLAAHRSALRRVILPRHNEADLDDVPEELRRTLEFVLADSAQQVLTEALGLDGGQDGRAAPGGSGGQEDRTPRAARPRDGRGPKA